MRRRERSHPVEEVGRGLRQADVLDQRQGSVELRHRIELSVFSRALARAARIAQIAHRTRRASTPAKRPVVTSPSSLLLLAENAS